jgi:cation diffusion facilitator CzcD-associated flavoprotein CzcO
VTLQVLVVGAGFSGLAMGYRLRQAGIDDFLIVDAGDEVGGTWRDNRYPGAACDVDSHLYSFSFAPNPEWSRKFAPRKEIFEYLVRCADDFGLRPHLRLRTRVVGAAFEDGAWRVEVEGGEVLRARVLVAACGGLSRPAVPDIPGLDRFEGEMFHTARWNDACALDGKTVAVIGTGASAIQVVPAIAPRVGRLLLFQRTPAWILPRNDRAIDGRWRAVYRRVPATQRLVRSWIYWRRELLAVPLTVAPPLARVGERMGRRFLARSVADPALRAKLEPKYTIGCKRVLPADDYYPALQRPNVTVVTTPIAEATPRGLRTADGAEHAVDALVLATGFEGAEQGAPFPVRGRDGQDLNQVWRAGAEAYLGTSVAGFPNLFLLVGPNTGLGHSSMVFMIEAQVRYVADAIRTLRRRGWSWVDVLPGAQARYNRRLHARLARTVWASGCDSWYRTRTGKNTTLWPGFTFEFALRARRFDPRVYEVHA